MRKRGLFAILPSLLLAAALVPAGVTSRAEDEIAAPQWIDLSSRQGTVRLLWVKDPRFALVRVSRRIEGRGSGFVGIGETSGNTYMDREVEGGVTYHYRLAAVDLSGRESPPSRARRITVEHTAAQEVSPPVWEGYVLIEGGVGLKWSARPDERVIAYNIYRKEGDDPAYSLVGSTSRTRFRDTAVETGKEYFYALSALGADFRESTLSPEISLVYAPVPERRAEEAVVWKIRRTRLVGIAEGEKAGLAWPVDVAVGAGSGNVYLSDSGRNRIFLFSGDGVFLRALGGESQDLFPFRKLLGLTLDGEENLYAVDSYEQTVMVIASDGTVRERIRLPRGEEGERGLIDLSLMGNGRLFVVDNTGSAVAVLEGREVVESFGGPGFEPGRLSAPTFCSTDGEGLFLLSDTMNGRVQIFDGSGEFVRSFGEYGQGIGRLARPKGVAVNGRGEIYVADSWQNVIQVFDSRGRFLAVLTDESGRLLDLGSPNGIALDGDNRIYIAERLAGRLQIREILDD